MISKIYEADVVLGSRVWEVKPLNGADPKPQLELYKEIGGLTEGEQLDDITGIPVFGDMKMRITFPNPGEARYSLYLDGDNGVKELTTAAAAAILFRELVKSYPGGRKLSPGF